MILHITSRTAWETANRIGRYYPDSLDNDGFIHCATLEQLLMPANALFRGRQDLVLLCIDPAGVRAPILYEDLYQSGHAFPHIYGPLETSAVFQVMDFPPNVDGTFDLPPGVAALPSLPPAQFTPHPYPILEYDPSPKAIIEPSQIVKQIEIPEHCLLCFFHDVITILVKRGKVRRIDELISEAGPNPVYELDIDGRSVALTHPGVGAPMSAFIFEELIARGSRKFIACGAAGALEPKIGLGQLMIPEIAIRDEGTSYHYLPPGREVTASPEAVAAIKRVLEQHQIKYVTGKTWTTDGFYRETAARVARRRAEGCLVVEMETAAFFAVAQFRGVTFGQILYGGDDLSGAAWDARDWDNQTTTREKLLWLSAEACLEL